MLGLSSLDYAIILCYLVVSIGLGVWFVRVGSKSSEAFFAATGKLPWWIAGSSLLVACFAADTPLWIGEIIYKRGLEGAWLYWAPGIGAAFFVMMIAPLWKRSGVLTDVEFLEIRYRGDAASVLRLINSAFYAVFTSIMWMGLQTLSLATIMVSITSMDKTTCVVLTTLFAGSYAIASGLWGIAGSGAFQFLITYVGSVVLAIYVLVFFTGGISGLVEQVHSLGDAWPQGSELNMLPSGSVYGLPAMTLVAWFLFRWLEQAGMGQYVAQRLIATQSPRKAIYAAMVWAVGFFAIVPLPWIITVIAAKVVLPDVELGKEAYPKMAMLLPTGLRGLLIASMLAAFMSTYSSLMNWGASYAINDFYRRFLVKNANERHYVTAARLYMLPMAVVASLMAIYAESLLNVIFVVLAVTCGYWSVGIARWLWWRVNVWSEITAWVGSVGLAGLTSVLPLTRHWWEPELMEEYLGHRTIAIVVGSLVLWVLVTYATRPTDPQLLDEFYRRNRPPGCWGPVRQRVQLAPWVSLPQTLSCWSLMLVGIYGPLIGLIKIAFGQPVLGTALTLAGIGGLILAVRVANRLYPDSAAGEPPVADAGLANARAERSTVDLSAGSPT